MMQGTMSLKKNKLACVQSVLRAYVQEMDIRIGYESRTLGSLLGTSQPSIK